MKKVKLIFGTTNSQPVGASDDDIEDVYQRSYKPFIRALYNAPHVRATLHYSGHLLQWLERHHAEFIDVLSELVGRKQVELLGGGFYEPIFPLIPRSDRLGQIERLTTYVRKLFGKRPRGLWVTGQIWDPMLPSLLKTSGMEYTFLSDYQFDAGGLAAHPVHEPCITEDEGKMVVVFPISSRLRSTCSEGSIDSVRAYLAEVASEEDDRVLSLLCPGENLRPGDAEDTFDESWIRDLFALLDEESSWILAATPSRYLKKASPRMRAYFPQAAFDPDCCRDASTEARADGYLPGTSIRTLLTRYPESNLMYAKMHYIHILVNQIRGDKYRKQLAREELWRGQCHAAYWSGGGWGGIYSNRLRKHIYTSLIEAEKVTREKGIFSPSIITVDFDMDGLSEFLYQGQEINAYVHKQGGAVFELDYLPIPWNYGDALSAVAAAGVDSGDVQRSGLLPYARNLFVDHFFDADRRVSVGDGAQNAERGDFVTRLYGVRQLSKDNHRIHLSALGSVETAAGAFPVEVAKEYGFDGGTINVGYRIQNRGETPLETGFGVELNLSLGANDSESMRLIAGQGSGEMLDGTTASAVDGVDSVRLYDLSHGVMLRLQYEQPARVDCAPVEARGADAENGAPARPAYQASVILPQWDLSLEPGESWSQQMSLTILAD